MSNEEIFSALGFNTLEAEVYIALMKNGPQTAYKISKLLNRPTANVYKAVDVLAEHGAVETAEGDVRICKAIPIQTVARQMEKAYKSKTENAIKQLGSLQVEKNDEGIYRLQTPEAVFERAVEMIKRAKKIIVLDVFPGAFSKIKPVLEQMASKKIEIFLQVYEPVKMNPGISMVTLLIGEQVLKHWNAEQLNIAVDGKEIIAALFSKDLSQVVQATYSNNLYLSCMLYSGLMSEHKVHLFTQAKTMKEIEVIKGRQKFFLNSTVPGIELLFEQYKKT